MLRTLFFHNNTLMDEFFPIERNNMSTNIKENGDHYIFEMELPGFTKKDIGISIEGNYLTVSASKEVDNAKDDKEKYILRERTNRSLKRRFYIGKLDKESVEANYEDGLLFITIKKSKDDIYSKKIEIK